MTQLIFTVYDRKSEAHGVPVFFRTVGEAERALSIQAAQPGGPLCDFPGDFDLCLVGEYDQESGLVVGKESIVVLGSVLDLLGDAIDIKAVI